ncbi:MAG: beta-lactamase regulator AmpE [Colwellia sp.]|nr:beta-lactamase regulator AmpE [Colwellia sp.]
MSLISLLIALAAERYLSSSAWQFNTYYKYYLKLIKRSSFVDSPWGSLVVSYVAIFIPVIACYLLLDLVDDGLLNLIVSTVVLIVCFGCITTRDKYKNYLKAAFRGETTTCELHHQQLQQDKNITDMSFGQLLVWLNYRYFIAIMIFFVLFGAPGALFYRLLTTLNEGNTLEELEIADEVAQSTKQFQFWLDWLPVRIVAFGYMLVGHFSKAMPIWLESLFDVTKMPHQLLISVAEKSEDFMVDADDCTAEPCLLVRLAKRTLLLCLAVIAILVLTGVLT